MDTSGTGDGRGRRHGGRARAGLAGAVLGVGAVVGALLVAATGVGAQPAPEDDLEAREAAAFAANEACLDEALGGAEPEAERTDEEWEILEAELLTCDDALDIELDEIGALLDDCLDELAELDEGDAELDEGEETVGEGEDADVVLVETGDSAIGVEFGEGDGKVVVTKDGGAVTVTTEGDLVTENLTEGGFAEAELEACGAPPAAG